MEQRITKQRKEIISYLQSVTSHPTAEKIHEQVLKKIKNISLGTVYRNLQILVDNKEIVRLEIDGEYHFDGCVDSHQHLICKSCKNIVDIFDKNMENNIFKSIKKNEFIPETSTIYIQGICAKCQTSKN